MLGEFVHTLLCGAVLHSYMRELYFDFDMSSCLVQQGQLVASKDRPSPHFACQATCRARQGDVVL